MGFRIQGDEDADGAAILCDALLHAAHHGAHHQPVGVGAVLAAFQQRRNGQIGEIVRQQLAPDLGGGDAGEPLGRPVEQLHPPFGVGDDHAELAVVQDGVGDLAGLPGLVELSGPLTGPQAGVTDGLLAVVDQDPRPAQIVGGLTGRRSADEGVAVGAPDLLPQLRDALEGHLLQGDLHQLFQHGEIRRRGKPVPGNADLPAVLVQRLADGDGVVDVPDGDLHQRVVIVGGEPGGVAGACHEHAAPQLPGLRHAGVLILQIAFHQNVFHVVVRQTVDDLAGHLAEL